MEKLILEIIVRSILIAAGAAITLRLLQIKAARVRHAVWASVVILMLVLPVSTTWGPKATLHVLPTPPAATQPAPIAIQQTLIDQDPPAVPVRSDIWTWQNALAALYLIGLSTLLTRLAIGTVRARTLVKRAAYTEGHLASDSCVAPITVGCLNPAVILPTTWTQWTRKQLDAVLAHENEHARRRDPLVQWLALLNRAVFWFHPLSWWLERRLSALSEEACDDAVLLRGHDPVLYSECLLSLARIVQQSGARLAVVGMAMPGTFLPQRIRRIVAGAPIQRISRARLACVGAACTVMSTLFTAGAVGYSVTQTQAPPAVVLADVQPTSAETSPEPIAPLPSRPASVRKQVLVAQEITPAKPTRAIATTPQSLSGLVVDPSGAVVPNAQVTLLNNDSGASVSMTTDSVGRFNFQGIQPGPYNVSLRVPGFKAEIQRGINVTAGDAHDAGKMILQVGSIIEAITITGSRSAPTAPPQPVARQDGITSLGPVTTVGPMTTLSTKALKPEQSAPGRPIRVGGNVQASRIIAQTRPVYPADALQQNVGGTVKIEAVLSKDGTLTGVKVITDPDPRLTQATLDAARLWRFEPTLLNGEPIEVITTIDANFVPGD